jgi:hypothetical protein
LVEVYRQQRILFFSSTHATCSGQYWPSSGIKYMIFKTQNKVHVYIEIVRSHKLYKSCKLQFHLKYLLPYIMLCGFVYTSSATCNLYSLWDFTVYIYIIHTHTHIYIYIYIYIYKVFGHTFRLAVRPSQGSTWELKKIKWRTVILKYLNIEILNV